MHPLYGFVLPRLVEHKGSNTLYFNEIDNLNFTPFLLIGGLGQLGTGLAKLMRKQFGRENVILSDIIRPSKQIQDNGKLPVIVNGGGGGVRRQAH